MKLNKKSPYVFLAVIAVVGIIGVHLHKESPKVAPMNDITLANLNAILGLEENGEKDDSNTEKDDNDPEKDNSDTEKDKNDPELDLTIPKTYYQSMHFAVFSYNQRTKKCTASCYASPYSKNPSCHSHDARECCYER